MLHGHDLDSSLTKNSLHFHRLDLDPGPELDRDDELLLSAGDKTDYCQPMLSVLGWLESSSARKGRVQNRFMMMVSWKL